MTVFASDGSISKAVLDTLNGEASLDKTQIRELLLRESNCDYPQQILNGLQTGQPLYTAVVEKVKTTGSQQTLLPAATRHYFNADSVLAGYGTQNYVSDIDDATVVTLGGSTENIIKSHQSKPPGYVSNIALGEFRYERDAKLKINLKASLGVYSGIHRHGQGHPVPVFRYPDGEVDSNVLYVDIDLVVVTNGEPDVYYLSWAEFFKENIQNMDIFSLYGSQMVELKMPTTGVTGSDAKVAFYLRVSRSPWIATFNGTEDKVAFIKQSAVNQIDTSNYIEVIEMGDIERVYGEPGGGIG